MDFKIDGENKELNFGVKFVAELDKTETIKFEDMFEFGTGMMMAEQKLGMGNIETLAKVIKSALWKEHVTLDDVYESLDEYTEDDKLEEIFDKITECLKNSKAVRATAARMKKNATEANRLKAVKQPTKTL